MFLFFIVSLFRLLCLSVRFNRLEEERGTRTIGCVGEGKKKTAAQRSRRVDFSPSVVSPNRFSFGGKKKDNLICFLVSFVPILYTLLFSFLFTLFLSFFSLVDFFLVVDFLFYARGGEDDDRRSARVSWRSVESETRGGGGRKQAMLAGWSSRSAGGLKGGIQKVAE
ncbi:hypothetical protein BDW42DRAFT_42844 [Aspergillus taichungensis]|uniref:Transmembrane protein n=1 Tax=Aspergillus taichungensis TaxID=482145 RepID=A0A2J5HEC2_9EURO|nr:hypothetical protein BDW42DRAFT_42844 [Aspergillus taichungensis]